MDHDSAQVAPRAYWELQSVASKPTWQTFSKWSPYRSARCQEALVVTSAGHALCPRMARRRSAQQIDVAKTADRNATHQR